MFATYADTSMIPQLVTLITAYSQVLHLKNFLMIGHVLCAL